MHKTIFKHWVVRNKKKKEKRKKRKREKKKNKEKKQLEIEPISCLKALLKTVLSDETCHAEGRIIPVKIFYYLHVVNRYSWDDSMNVSIKIFWYPQTCNTISMNITVYITMFCFVVFFFLYANMCKLWTYYSRIIGKILIIYFILSWGLILYVVPRWRDIMTLI